MDTVIISDASMIGQQSDVREKKVASVEQTALPDLAPPLLPTEKIGPMGWVRTLFHFELPDNYDADAIAAMLKRSYQALKDRVPIAGCEAVPAPGPQAGLLQLRHYGDEIEDFLVKDFRSDLSFPSFSELESRGFPSEALDPAAVCRRGLGGEWPTAGDRLNVTMLQANFIRGGLLLNMLTLHAYADCTTAYKFTELLAEEVRRSQNIPIDAPADVPWEDRAKLLEPSGLNPGNPEDHPEYVELPFTPQGPPPKLMSPIHHGHVFYFSNEKIAELKKAVAPANVKLFKGQDLPQYVSTNDAIAALIWRCTMASQHAEAQPSGPSILGVALDARRRTGMPIHKHTLGNILGFAPAILDMSDLLGETSLADLAVCVRRAVEKSEKTYHDNLSAWVHRLGDVSRLAPTMFLDMPGNHMLVSSWREFPFYDLQWGPALGGQMKAIRPPAVGITHSMHVVLPDRKERAGGVEVFVGVESSAMDRLLSDPLWQQYAEAPQGLN